MTLSVMHRIISSVLHEGRLFLVALQFLTRVPVPSWVGWQADWMAASMRHFPVVGAVVGLWGALVLVLAASWWPPVVAVGLSMAATVWLTGGFHEDGWADTCDGLGGAVGREKALAIMKDSRLGTYGALGLFLLLGLKAAVLVELLSPRMSGLDSVVARHVHEVLLMWTGVGLVWAHAVSRALPVVLTRLLPYAGDLAHAKTKPLALSVGSIQVGLTIVMTVLVGAALGLFFAAGDWPWPTLGRALLSSLLGVLLVGGWMWVWLRRRLGGFTGDTLGASQQLGEVAALLGWLLVVHPMDL